MSDRGGTATEARPSPAVADVEPEVRGTRSRPGIATRVLVVLLTAAALSGAFSGVQLGPVSASALVTAVSFVALWVILVANGLRATPVAAVAALLVVALIGWQVAAGIGGGLGGDAAQQALLWSTVATGLMAASATPEDELPAAVAMLHRAMVVVSALMVAALALRWAGPLQGVVSLRVLGLAALVPLAWFLASWQGRERRSAQLALALVVLVVLTLSRTASACAVLALIVSRPSSDRRQRRLRTFFGVGSFVAAWWTLSYWDPLRSRFFDGDVSLRLGPIVINGMGRARMWSVIGEAVGEAPVTGHGLATVRERMADVAHGLEHPHQDYLRLLYEGGAVGLLLWLAVVALSVRALWRRYEDTRGEPAHVVVRAGLLVLLLFSLSALTDNPMAYSFMLLPLSVLVGLGLAVPRKRGRGGPPGIGAPRPAPGGRGQSR